MTIKNIADTTQALIFLWTNHDRIPEDRRKLIVDAESIQLGPFEVRAFDEPTPLSKWALYESRHVSNYPHAPDDVDVELINDFSHWIDAAIGLFVRWIEWMVRMDIGPQAAAAYAAEVNREGDQLSESLAQIDLDTE